VRGRIKGHARPCHPLGRVDFPTRQAKRIASQAGAAFNGGSGHVIDQPRVGFTNVSKFFRSRLIVFG
jgi:hypothetical protein